MELDLVGCAMPLLHGSQPLAVLLLAWWNTYTESAVRTSFIEMFSKTPVSSSAEQGPCTVLARPE